MKKAFSRGFGIFCSLLVLSAVEGLLAAAPAAAQKTENVAHQQYLGLVADPGNLVKGSTFYRSDLDVFRIRAGDVQYWDGSSWLSFPRPGSGLFSRLNSIRIVEPTLWPGGTVTADIDAAMSDCGSSVCLVLYPSTLDAGEATAIPQNVTTLDLRQTRFNNSLSGGLNARVAGLFSQRRLTTAPAQPFDTLHNLLLYEDAQDGGDYSSTSKVTYLPLALYLDGRTRGQHALLGGTVFGFGISDALIIGATAKGWGGRNVTGTSQPTVEFAEIHVDQGDLVFTATVSGDPASGATTISYTPTANENTLGERALINTSRTSTAGTVTSISTDNVNFDATAPDWNAGSGACDGVLDPCNPVGQYFKMNADDVSLGGVSTGHWYRVIAVVDADTFQVETTYDSLAEGLATSGAYTLAQGAEILSFDTAAKTLTIEANSYDWGAGDNLISPPMPLLNFRGLNLLLTKQLKTGTARAIDISNTGPFAWGTAVKIEGAPSGANAFTQAIDITSKSVDAIRVSTATLTGAALLMSSNQVLRWGTNSDLTHTGTNFLFNKRTRIEGESASGIPLVIKQTQASPTVSHFAITNSGNSVLFEVDKDAKVNLKTGFQNGLTLDPATTSFSANGTLANLNLNLNSKGTGAVRVNSTNSSGTGGFEVYDGAATPNKIFSVSSTGVGPNDRGFKHARVSTGLVSAGASAGVTLTWTTAFADANYTVTCSLVEATTATSTLRLHHIESVVAGSVTVRVVNDDGAAAHTGTLHCTAVHD